MNVMKFAREVRAEVSKVTWPSFRDTRMITLMVFVLAVFFAIYLWLVDLVVGGGVRLLLGN